MPDLPMNRTKVFISYSHKDKHPLKELHTHLDYFRRQEALDVWDDTKIKPGTQWRDEIEQAINSAKIAILLVSPDFLASSFIAENELPPLLAAASREGVIILPVILSSCLFSHTELAQFQAVNEVDKPLDSLTRAKRNEVWKRAAELVKDALESKAVRTPPPQNSLKPVANAEGRQPAQPVIPLAPQSGKEIDISTQPPALLPTNTPEAAPPMPLFIARFLRRFYRFQHHLSTAAVIGFMVACWVLTVVVGPLINISVTFTSGSCLVILQLIAASLGYWRGWRREITTMAVLASGILFLLLGGNDLLYRFIFVNLSAAFRAVFGSNTVSEPPPDASSLQIGGDFVFAVVVFLVLAGSAYIIGHKLGHRPVTTKQKLGGLMVGIVNGYFITFYTVTHLIPQFSLSVEGPVPNAEGVTSYFTIGFLAVGAGILVARILSRIKKGRIGLYFSQLWAYLKSDPHQEASPKLLDE